MEPTTKGMEMPAQERGGGEMSEELDREVAEKVMGWKWNSGLLWWDVPPDGTNIVADFQPSSNIADAWLVVEKMPMSIWPVFKGFEATVYHWCAELEGDYEGFAEADTAPEAICKAALKAIVQ